MCPDVAKALARVSGGLYIGEPPLPWGACGCCWRPPLVTLLLWPHAAPPRAELLSNPGPLPQ